MRPFSLERPTRPADALGAGALVEPGLQEQTCGYHINLAAHLPLTQALFTQTPLGLGGAEPLICENVGNAAGVADARGLLANAGRLGALLAGERAGSRRRAAPAPSLPEAGGRAWRNQSPRRRASRTPDLPRARPGRSPPPPRALPQCPAPSRARATSPPAVSGAARLPCGASPPRPRRAWRGPRPGSSLPRRRSG